MKVVLDNLTCEVCNKRVDRLEKYTDYKTGDVVFKVFWHGDCETARISLQDIRNASSIQFTTAFKKKIALHNECILTAGGGGVK